jgi:hypothetical protein
MKASLRRGKSSAVGPTAANRKASDGYAAGAAGRTACARLLHFAGSGFGLNPFLRGLIQAYGWRYCAAVVAQYGMNQGAGMSLLALAAKFYAFSSLGISAAAWGRLNGLASIPWQLKAIFGLLSDTVSIRGLHRSPYLIVAGGAGILGSLLLAVLPASSLGGLVFALLLLLNNLNVALADVVVDATVAVQCKDVPAQAAQLQSLSWGSFGAFGAVSVALAGYMIEFAPPRLPFGIAAVCSGVILVPARFNWLEKGRLSRLPLLRCIVRQLCAHQTGRLVLVAALIVGVYSIVLGAVQVGFGSAQPLAVAVATIVGNCGLCALLFYVLRQVDATMAKAVVFAFLRGAIVPSTEIIFEWAHDPVGGDLRCLSSAECAALGPAANSSSAEAGLPCGWAAARGHPCLPPNVFSWSYVAGMLTIVLGTVLYSSSFASWRFRSLLAAAHSVLAAAGLIDLIFVYRANQGWLPDWVLFLFGDAVFVGLVDRLGDMAFFIFSAKLCPPAVEGSMFALQMGVSNFGSHAGMYLGTAILEISYPRLHAPDFAGLSSYITLRSALRALPIFLVPILVPRGCPNNSSKDIGAGAAITDTDDPDAGVERACDSGDGSGGGGGGGGGLCVKECGAGAEGCGSPVDAKGEVPCLKHSKRSNESEGSSGTKNHRRGNGGEGAATSGSALTPLSKRFTGSIEFEVRSV